MKNGERVICPDEIEGLRILLRPITPEYAEEIFKEFTPEITTYMFPRSASHLSETELFIAESCKQRKAGTDLGFVILDKRDHEFLGVCGLHGRNPKQPEFGIWLKRDAQRKALGREAINLLKDWGERTLAIQAFIYPVDRRNQSSRRIPELLGGKIIGGSKVTSMNGTELDVVVYLIPLSSFADSRS